MNNQLNTEQTHNARKGPDSIKGEGGPLYSSLTAFVYWVLVSAGFMGMKVLMHERPQFTGADLSVSNTRLVQESPQVFVRKQGEDVDSILRAQPDFSDITFNMEGRRDYRGLKTILDMDGQFSGVYTISNGFSTPVHVLFHAPHPRSDAGHEYNLSASNLKMQASLPGMEDLDARAWEWSGTLGEHAEMQITLSYDVSRLNAIRYDVKSDVPGFVNAHKVQVDLDGLESMICRSSEGTKAVVENQVLWQKGRFLAPDFFEAKIGETRNLYTGLMHLIEIGPMISLLFLITLVSTLLIRQRATSTRILTLTIAYGLYFPLIIYLSVRMDFRLALIAGLLIPGLLFLNYSRWILGTGTGLWGGFALLLVYQLLPTLASMSGWNRGMVVLALGIITLGVLIHFQNMQMKRMLTLACLCVGCALSARAQNAQVIIPADVQWQESSSLSDQPPLITLDNLHYDIRMEETYAEVTVTAQATVLRPGNHLVTLFKNPVYIHENRSSTHIKLHAAEDAVSLFPTSPEPGNLDLSFKVPIIQEGSVYQLIIPPVWGRTGTASVHGPFDNLKIHGGVVWEKTQQASGFSYSLGVSGVEVLKLEWPVHDALVSVNEGNKISDDVYYGIGIDRANHVTLVNADGSASHYTEFLLPRQLPDFLELILPMNARVISVALDGIEIPEPQVNEGRCRIDLSHALRGEEDHRLSVKFNLPRIDLGFRGLLEFELPGCESTIGTVDWLVSLPSGFEMDLVSGTVYRQSDLKEMLSHWPAFNRALSLRPTLGISRNLVPPSKTTIQIHYKQRVEALRSRKEM